MKENTTDLMMRFVLNKNPVEAECALDVAPGDTLMEDFVHKAGSTTFGNYFEVRDFSFGVSLKENDKSSSPTDESTQSARAGLSPAGAAYRRTNTDLLSTQWSSIVFHSGDR